MNSKDQNKRNFFIVPHQFEEMFGEKLRPSEKYFYIALRKLSNRFGRKTGKNKGIFWHTDKKFKKLGFSPSFSRRTRKKLEGLGLVKAKRGLRKNGYGIGTYYRLDDSMFDFEKNPGCSPNGTQPNNMTSQNDL